MSLTANIYPATIALVGNPIKLTIVSSSQVEYSIFGAEEELYTGSGEGEFHVYIHEILASFLKPVHVTSEQSVFLIPVLENSCQCTIRIQNKEGDSTSLEFKAIIGGISKRSLRSIHEANANIFTFKLLNDATNFFMTTRTTSQTISVRETEILPLQFLYPMTGTLKVKTGIHITELEGVPGETYALNIENLRVYLFGVHSQLFNLYKIFVNDMHACDIVITPSNISSERYILEFLNSYGRYERVEITGVSSLETETENADTYGIYDNLVDDYVESRERVSGRNILSVESGYKTDDELIFLLDMLSSDDIRLIGYEARPLKVNVSAENLVMAAKSKKLQSLKLKIRFADLEHHYTQFLQEKDFIENRIHTEQFSNHFN